MSSLEVEDGISKVHQYSNGHSNGTMTYNNRIADSFIGKKVFITGGTGFLGKVLIEKLLRTCHGVDTIYVLARGKKNKSPRERLEEQFDGPLYELLRNLKGNEIFSKKVKTISGDVSLPDLGISPSDREMLIKNVNVIYHCAATIRFDEPLKNAVFINARGTNLMLDLAAEMKNLDIFFHVSTAYCHLDEKVLKEQTYPPPADPHKIISCMEWMDDETAGLITDKILRGMPNTYAFTKALGEGLVEERMSTLPVVILRPSIVVPVWKDPLPGWTDNVNGPTGLLIGAGKGVIRTMYCHSDGFADFVPVDCAVAAMLIIAHQWLSNNKTENRVYNLTTSSEIKLCWGEILDYGKDIVTNKIPFNDTAWYPGGSVKKSKLHHYLCLALYHFLPAIIGDILLFVLGYEPVLIRVQKKICKGFEVFEYYTDKQWYFDNDKILKFREEMNPREMQEFYISAENVDIAAYFENCVEAARLYILKEPKETLPRARRHMKMMYIISWIATFLFYGLMIWAIMSYSETARSAFTYIWHPVYNTIFGTPEHVLKNLKTRMPTY